MSWDDCSGMVSGEAFLAGCRTPFVDGVSMQTSGNSVGYVTLFKTQGTPNIIPMTSTDLNLPVSVSLGGYEYYCYIGLSGSAYTLNYTLNAMANFYVFTSDSQFNDWVGGSYYSPDYYGTKYAATYTLSSDGKLYFVWYDTSYNAPTGAVTVVRNENTYDTSTAIDSCASSSCTMMFNNGECAIIAAYPPTPAPGTQLNNINYDVIANTGTYWMIGGIILAVLVVLLAGAVGFVVWRKRHANYSVAGEMPPTVPAPQPVYGGTPQYGGTPAYDPNSSPAAYAPAKY